MPLRDEKKSLRGFGRREGSFLFKKPTGDKPIGLSRKEGARLLSDANGAPGPQG